MSGRHLVAARVVALRTAENNLLILRAMQLNSAVTAAQKVKARVVFPARRLAAPSDGSFKRDGETGYGMGGASCMRMGRCRQTGRGICHLLDAAGRSRKLVCKPSFGSEQLAACGAADGLRAPLLTPCEIARGRASPGETRRLREEDVHGSQVGVVIDGMLAFSAFVMHPVKPPCENGVPGHF